MNDKREFAGAQSTSEIIASLRKQLLDTHERCRQMRGYMCHDTSCYIRDKNPQANGQRWCTCGMDKIIAEWRGAIGLTLSPAAMVQHDRS